MNPTKKTRRYRPKVATKAELAFEMSYYASFRRVHARLVERSRPKEFKAPAPTNDGTFGIHHKVPVLNYRRFPETYQKPNFYPQWQAKDNY